MVAHLRACAIHVAPVHAAERLGASRRLGHALAVGLRDDAVSAQIDGRRVDAAGAAEAGGDSAAGGGEAGAAGRGRI
eukprot:688866-Prymnesium_polylepis.1